MSRRRLTPDNLPGGTSDPASPTPRAGDLFYRTDTGRVRVYTGTVWTDAGLTGPTGPAGGQEIAYAGIATNFTLVNAGGIQDVTGLQITVPAGQACNIEAELMISLTSSAALGTGVAPTVWLTDTSNTSIAAKQISFILAASGAATATYYRVIKRLAALASPTTYKVRVTPPAANTSAAVVNTSTNNEECFIRAMAR